MRFSDAQNHRWGDPDENDPLVQRLRNLSWAEVTPELRERSWREFSERLEERERARTTARTDVDGAWHLDYSRARGQVRGLVASHRMAVGNGWARDRRARSLLAVG